MKRGNNLGNRYSKQCYKITGVAGCKTGYLLWKRLMDILCAVIALVLLLLPSLLVALLVRITSKGTVIYKQERLGQDGKPFTVYKFRTMRTDAENKGPQFATPDDERCTRIGTYLRRMRIDEWPQFWNVLIGDMSIVGPRPERAYFYQEFSETIPRFRERLLVKPGLTGYAQVYGGLYLKPAEKLEHDLYYIAHQGVLLDLRCMLKTVFVIIKLLICGE